MKRFVCFLLTLVMIVSLVPATVLTASAASSLNTSDKAIEILKQFEGFSAESYEDGGKYYIGYGTLIDDPSVYPTGITKSQATQLLKKHIEEKVDKAINNFAKKFNMAFSQNQHDALALFSYNCGTGWMSTDGAFRAAVVNGKRGNDFLNAIALWSGGSPHSDYFKGLMNRRLAEANMYLNNSYSFYAPANYTYVVLDTDGGALSDAYGNNMYVYAYDSSSAPAIELLPTKTGHRFVGWYVDGHPVTTLDKTVAGRVIIAKWQLASGEVSAQYDINSSQAASLTVYNDHSIYGTVLGTLKPNSKFTVIKEFVDEKNVKWVGGTGKNDKGKDITGWVALCDLDEIENAGDSVLATGTVTAATLNVREAATTSSTKIGTITKGTKVQILAYKNEYTAAGTVSWGKIMHNGSIGWINLAYVDMKNSTTGDNDSIYGKTGKIVNADPVNIRSAAGVGNPKVAELRAGTAVTVYETVQIGSGINSATWGRIKWDGVKEGWVYMYYVQLDGSAVSGDTISGGGTSSGSEVAIYTGVVNSNTSLNVRRNPRVTSTHVGSLPKGTRINIYEVTTTNGVDWGRTDSGWVCLLYVSLTSTGNTPSTGGNHVLKKSVGTITAATLSLRKAPTNNSDQLAVLKQGDTVTILAEATEATSTGSKVWGKVEVNGVTGWINLAYVDIKETTTLIPDTEVTPGPDDGVPGIIANCVKINVRTAPGVGSPLATTLASGTKVTVYEQIEKNNAPWGRIDQGWVCMYYVTLGGTTTGGNTDNGTTGGTTEVPGATTPGVISATGIVNSNTDLNVRSGAGLGYAKVGTLQKGTKVTIYEQKIADGMIWGKTNTGWVCMSYITIDSSTNSGTGVMGTVARCFSHVNVRSAPGTGSALVGTIQVGARVEVYEQKLYSGQYWGRVAQGWVCMQYILLDSELPPTEDTPTTTPSTGNGNVTGVSPVNPNPAVSFYFTATVTENVDVRKDALVESDLAGTLSAGTSVNVVALKANETQLWGKINDYGTPGWINLASAKFSIYGYAQVDFLTVYSVPSTSGEDLGVRKMNESLHVYGLALEGTNVWGKIDVDTTSGVVGWVQMSKIGSAPSAHTETDIIASVITGKTFAAIDAYTAVDAQNVAFKLTSGATVYVAEVVCDHGTIWGRVQKDGVTGWIDLNKVAYVFTTTVNNAGEALAVRNVPFTDDNSAIIGELPDGSTVMVTSLMASSVGSLWGQIQTADGTNGGWIRMSCTTF